MGVRVLYARLEGMSSARLAERFVERPGACLADGQSLSYFADSGDVDCYELCALKIATRVPQITRRPGGSWVCFAPNDVQALSLARLAAVREWSQPASRRPEAFTVQFVDPSPLLYRGAAARS